MCHPSGGRAGARGAIISSYNIGFLQSQKISISGCLQVSESFFCENYTGSKMWNRFIISRFVFVTRFPVKSGERIEL
jgi:hypothetical protein